MIGCDFERFLERNGRIITSEFLGLPSKGELPVELGEGAGFIHRDNVMVEMCPLPAPDGGTFFENVRNTLINGLEFLRERDPELSLSSRMSATFDPADLASEEAQELGCDADYVVGVQDSQKRARLNADILGNDRFCGGHIHFSWDNEAPAWVGASVADLLLAPAVGEQVDGARSKFYGLLGLHRPTNYPDGSSGVEYRALDSFWTADFGELMRVGAYADIVHQCMNKGSFEFLQKLLNVHALHVKPNRFVRNCGELLMDAHEEALGLFTKEFGYDPV